MFANAQVIMVEVLHNFGLVILVLRVLPCFGGLYGLGIMHSICLVPSILSVVFASSQKNRRPAFQTYFKGFLDIIAMLLSIAAVAMPIIVTNYDIVNVCIGCILYLNLFLIMQSAQSALCTLYTFT